MRGNMTRAETIALYINYLFFLILIISMILPVLMLIARSVSSERAILTGTVGILPDLQNLKFDSYLYVIGNKGFMQGFAITVTVTLLGSSVAMVVTSHAAYAVSKPYLRGRKVMLLFSIFTMIFSGGLIPTYLVINALGLLNTFHILWMAGVFSTMNMLILKSTFESVPVELEEAAVIDGAGQFSMLWRIYLPVSKAALAVIALFYAVEYWNNYHTSMMFTTMPQLRSLQLVLKDIIYSASDVFLELHGVHAYGEITAQSTVAASVIVATIPILAAYPFLQKHFAKGVMIGSVKG